jgi:RecA/RadA recombinase
MTRKATAKTNPKPTAKPASKKFSILDNGASVVAAAREALARDEADVLIAGDPNKKHIVLPVPSFGFCTALKARGLVSGTVIDIIGADGLGKSPFGYMLMGWNMAANGPVMHIETEGKPIGRERAEAALHPDRKIAAAMYDAVYREHARELREAINKMEAWLITVRKDSRIPKSSPAMVVIDTFSKLMSPSEAAGFSVYDSKKDKEKKKQEEKKAAAKAAKKGDSDPKPEKAEKFKDDTTKELGSGSNFEHAKLSHEWTRRLAYFLGHYNAILVVLRHQNDKIDMGAGGGIMLSEDQKAAINRTTIGGKAIYQSAAYQFILSRRGFFKASVNGMQENVGLDVKLNVAKNGWGPSGVDAYYRVSLQPRRATEERYEPAIEFDTWIPEILMRHKLMNIRMKNVSTVITPEFEPHGRAEEIPLYQFCEMFYQRGLADVMGRRLGFAHYGDNATVSDLIVSYTPVLVEADADAADPDAPKIEEPSAEPEPAEAPEAEVKEPARE